MHRVVSGDTLTRISSRYYGTPSRWQEIYNANRDKLGSADALPLDKNIIKFREFNSEWIKSGVPIDPVTGVEKVELIGVDTIRAYENTVHCLDWPAFMIQQHYTELAPETFVVQAPLRDVDCMSDDDFIRFHVRAGVKTCVVDTSNLRRIIHFLTILHERKLPYPFTLLTDRKFLQFSVADLKKSK